MLQKMYLDNIDQIRGSRTQGEYAEGVRSKKLNFQFYWHALKKNKWLIILFTALVTVVAIYFAQAATPIYSAKSTLLLESQKANIISIEDLVSSEQESKDYYGTQYAILKSRLLAERVIRDIELRKNISQEQLVVMLTPSTSQEITRVLQSVGPDLSEALRYLVWGKSSANSAADIDSPSVVLQDLEQGAPSELQDRIRRKKNSEILGQFRKSLRVNPVANTKLVSINYESTDAEFSALVANAVANQYIESVIEQRQTIKENASEWMNWRITQLKVILDQSEEELLSFKKANGLVELGGNVGQLNEQELQVEINELALANNALFNATGLFREIGELKASTPRLLETLPLVQNDILVRSATTELGKSQRDLAELRNHYGEKHPKIVDAKSRLASLRLTLNGHIERIVSTFESDYQLKQQRVASLQDQVGRSKENIQLIGQQKITLETLEREVDANRDQYNSLFDRITETRTADGLDEANAVLAEAAWVPVDSIKPVKFIIIGLAFFCSLMLSAIVAFVIEFLDDTVSSTEDIERRLKTKLLGVLPFIGSGILRRKKSVPLIPQDVRGKSEFFLEAVNSCRTALEVSNERKLEVILITSSVPDEGKSTVALNLAYSFGKLKRTLLIDCDLRRPSIGRALGIPLTDAGLTSYLMQRAPLEQCIKRGVLDSFDCLTSGPVHHQPLDMLSSVRFAKAMEGFRRDYDRIIIDSAPTHIVSDALVLSKLADSVLYVVRPYKTSMKLIDSGLSKLAEARANVAGVCISQADIDKSLAYGGFELYAFGDDYL